MFIFKNGALFYYMALVVVMAALFAANEVARRWKYVGFFCFVIFPAGLSVLWFTVLKDVTYTDWVPPCKGVFLDSRLHRLLVHTACQGNA